MYAYLNLNPRPTHQLPHPTQSSQTPISHLISHLFSASSILTLQPLLNTLHLLRIPNLNNPPRLALIPHQLFRARIQHARLLVARRRQVREHHVRHAQAAGRQRQRVGEQDEARGVVGQVVAEVLHGGVDAGVGLLVDFEGGFGDLVFFGGKRAVVSPLGFLC